MQDFVRSEIAKRLAELKTLEARVSVLRIELGVLESLLANAPKEPDVVHPDVVTHAPKSPPSSGASGAAEADRGKGVTSGRSLREKWAVVLAEAVKRYPSCVTNSEVGQIQLDHGIEPASSRENVRAHFWTCTKAGLYEHAGHATYRATQKAAVAVGAPLGNGTTKNDEPPPERANGSVAGEGEDAQPSPPSLWSNP